MSTIILLEDEPLLCTLYQMHLEQAGHVVIPAHNSKNILALLREHRPDLVITDLIMPEHEGMEAIFLISRETRIPLIAISANGAFLHMAASLVTATLQKPFSGDQLCALVARLLPSPAPTAGAA